jgi:hypothetical protein
MLNKDQVAFIKAMSHPELSGTEEGCGSGQQEEGLCGPQGQRC